MIFGMETRKLQERCVLIVKILCNNRKVEIVAMVRKDELHVSLPDVNPYLERIGISGPVRADLETLDLLIRQQQYEVPFEDLDQCIAKKAASTDITVLFDKIVVQKRGGYCFEQNTLFAQLLEDLGYDVDMVFVRIVRGMSIVRPCLHCAMIVTMPEGRFFCDVGYGGPMPGGFLKVEDGYERVILGEHFGITKEDEYWWTVWRITSEGIKEDVLQFNLFPQSRAEFIPANAFCSGPGAIFSRMKMINRRTPEGHVSITDNTFRIEEGGAVRDEEIGSDERLEEILDVYFGLGGVLEKLKKEKAG